MTLPTLKPFHLLAALNVGLLGALAWSNANSQAQPPVQDVIRARSIDLVDASGAARVQLYVGENGGGNIRMRAPNGEVRVKLGTTDDGAILLMMDGRADPSVRLASEKAGPNLRLVDPAGRGDVVIASSGLRH